MFLKRFLWIIFALKLRRSHIGDILSRSILLPDAGAFGLRSEAEVSAAERLQAHQQIMHVSSTDDMQTVNVAAE
ncbi:MAG TPA: hypothetical protein PK215_08955, partial [Clostridiales bacterium]|nr:hypothetical protein [Clostridiales bacterium]